ncbi:MAG: DMT family transporter, partial [Thermoplasmata archaeon]|nr:DMT family transporter [Thermoplasmata archaeon]
MNVSKELFRNIRFHLLSNRISHSIRANGSYRAILLMLGSGLFMASVAACVKYLSDDIPVPEIVFFRNITGGILILAILAKRKVNPLGVNRRVLLLRGVCGTLGVFFYFYAISQLVLADAVMLNRTSPFFVVILSLVFLHERIRRLQVPALILAVLGIILITRPRLDYSFLPAAIALLSAVFAGAAHTTLRHLRHTDTPFVIVLYFTLVSSLSMIPLMAMGLWETPDPHQLAILLGMGLLGLGGQHLMTTAYRYAQAGEVAIYGYSHLIFSMILGMV